MSASCSGVSSCCWGDLCACCRLSACRKHTCRSLARSLAVLIPMHQHQQPALPLLGNFPKILGIWEWTWDLGNFPSNLGNSGISRKFHEILVIPNLQRRASVVFIRYLTAAVTLPCFCNHCFWAYLLWTNRTYLDELISIINWFVQHWSKPE